MERTSLREQSSMPQEARAESRRPAARKNEAAVVPSEDHAELSVWLIAYVVTTLGEVSRTGLDSYHVVI